MLEEHNRQLESQLQRLKRLIDNVRRYGVIEWAILPFSNKCQMIMSNRWQHNVRYRRSRQRRDTVTRHSLLLPPPAHRHYKATAVNAFKTNRRANGHISRTNNYRQANDRAHGDVNVDGARCRQGDGHTRHVRNARQ